MRVVLRFIATDGYNNQISGYPFRWPCWAISVALHIFFVLALVIVPAVSPRSSRELDAERFEAKHVQKILLSPFARKLPDVSSSERVRESPPPRGKELAPKTKIARGRRARSRRQMIWQPVPKIEVPQDVPAPNMILSRATQLLLRPPPVSEKPPAKAPDPGARAQAPPNPPKATKSAPKTFAPPPQRVREPKLPVASPLLDAQAPAIAAANTSLYSPLAARLGAPAIGAPPPSTGAPAATQKSGDASVDLAVAGLNPADAAKEIPDGERSARFSQAPALGSEATGNSDKAGDVVIPNLTILDGAKVAPKPEREAVPSRLVLYSERLRGIGTGTFSVPLRPTSRAIPAAVDARFRGRNVYTMVVPIENFQAYSGDWILWFAAKDAEGQDATSIAAPVPFQKREPIETPNQGPTTTQRMQIWAVIKRDGRPDIVSISSKAGPLAEQALTRDFLSWEFRPATRNNRPVEVDAVFEIPFNLPGPAK